MMKGEYTDNVLPQEKLNGIYRGVVENNKDPKKAGRCKIRVIGIHTANILPNVTDSVPTANLVWAQPACPIFGGISKVGMYGLPCQGAHVFLFFENGNIMQPRYFATAPGIPRVPANRKYGFSDPDQVYPKETGGEPDWNKGDTENIYGDTTVFEDKCGNRIVFNSTPGNEYVLIENGGEKRANTKYSCTGTVKSQSSKGTSENFTGAQRTVVGGDSEFIITGVSKESAASKFASVLGDKKEIVAGSSDASVTGIENKTSGGMSWQVKGDSDIMTAGAAAYVSDAKTTIKSNTNDIKLEATLQNIKLQALLGKVESTSLSIDMTATTTALLKGLITSTLGGGIITKVDGLLTQVNGSALCQITGGIIMIG